MSAGLSPTLLAVSLLWPFGGDLPKDKDTLGSLDAQQVEIPQTELKLDAERLARDYYRQFLASGDGSPERRSEALRRLADLELEAGESSALASDVERLDAQSYREAVQLYRQMLSEHPDYPRNDLVLYQLARAQESGGDPQSALTSLDLLVSRYPSTALMDEVQFRRGELLFAQRDWRAAERAYASVSAIDADSPFAENARYKQGWSWFKLGDYDQALDAFESVVDHRFAGMDTATIDDEYEQMPRAVREMLDDTLRVASLSYSYLASDRTLTERLERAGRPAYAHLYYLALADLYLSQKRYTDAADTLSAFVEANPLHPRAPYVLMRTVTVFEDAGFADQAFDRREQFIERFGLERAYWQQERPENHPQVVAYLRDSLWMLTQQAHHDMQQAEQSRKPDAQLIAQRLAYAIAGYRRYIAYFPADERAPEANFLLAELHYLHNDAIAAIAEFERTAYDYPPHARSAEAAYRAVLAYRRQTELNAGTDNHRDWELRGMAARLRFAQAYPGHEHALLALVDAAEGFARLGEREPALQAAQAVIDSAAASPEQRRLAWQVIGNARIDSGEWALAEHAFLQMRAIDQQFARRDASVDERLAASVYRQAELARDAGNAEAAVGHFARVAQLTPESPIRVKADYDAAQTMLRAGNTAAAIPLLQAFRQAHPQDPLSESVTASLALAYVEVGDKKSAASEMERIAGAPATAVAARQEALLRAAELYRELKDLPAEKRLLERFIRDFPNEFNDVLESRQRLYDIAIAQGSTAEAGARARDLVAMDAAAGAQRSDRSRYLAAHASLMLAQPLLEQYRGIVLRAPLSKSVKLKRQHMERALETYARIAAYGVADAQTEASFQTAQLYSDFARALYDSERPAGLDDEALEEYQLMLEEQAFPLEEKAIAIHEANVRRAADGVYDDWVKRSYARLAELSPGRWSKSEIGDRHVESLQ